MDSINSLPAHYICSKFSLNYYIEAAECSSYISVSKRIPWKNDKLLMQ